MSKRLSHFSIRAKIVVAFALLLRGTIGLGLFAVDRLAGVSATADDLRGGWLPAARALGDVARYVERLRSNQALLINATGDDRSQRLHYLQQQTQLVGKAFLRYSPTVTLGEEQRLADSLTAAWQAYEGLSEKYADMILVAIRCPASRAGS